MVELWLGSNVKKKLAKIQLYIPLSTECCLRLTNIKCWSKQYSSLRKSGEGTVVRNKLFKSPSE